MEFFEDGRLELYNLDNDLGETQNLAAAEPAKVKELRARMLAWRTETGAKMPTANTPTEAPKKQGKGKGKKKKKSAPGLRGGDAAHAMMSPATPWTNTR